MCKSLQALVATVAVFGLIAASARLTVAQQADDNDAGMQILVSPSAVPSEHREKERPLDVAGCWSGETEDVVVLISRKAIFALCDSAEVCFGQAGILRKLRDQTFPHLIIPIPSK